MNLSQEQKGLIKWLTTDWLTDREFKICVIQGFPGAGKTSIASEVLGIITSQHDFKATFTSVSDNEHFSADDFFFQLSQDLSIAGIKSLEESITEHGNTKVIHAIKDILLHQKVCIIIDEAQWAMDETGVPDLKLQRLFETIGTLPLKGRAIGSKKIECTHRDCYKRGNWRSEEVLA